MKYLVSLFLALSTLVALGANEPIQHNPFTTNLPASTIDWSAGHLKVKTNDPGAGHAWTWDDTTNNFLTASNFLAAPGGRTNDGGGLTNLNVSTNGVAGDITGTIGATVAAFVGGQTAANVAAAAVLANAATSNNTASTIVKRGSDGSFAANGSSITNIQSILNDSDALRFCQSNQVTSPSAVFDFARFIACMKGNNKNGANIWTNLVDGIVTYPRFNSSNGFSIKGNSFTQSNVTYTSWAASFNGTNTGMRLALPSSTTSNTIVVVWRASLTGASDSWLVGVENTNLFSAYWLYANSGFGSEPWESSGTNLPYANTSPSSYNSLIQPQWISGFNYQELGPRANQRKVWAITSDGAGHRQFFQDTVVGKIGFASPNFIYTSPVVNSDPVNTLFVGTAPYTQLTNIFGNFKGEIAAVLVFNTTNTAVIQASYTALRYLETDEVERFWVGDSRMSSDISGTNNFPSAFQTLRPWENCWHNYAQGGTTAGQFASYSTNAVWLLPSDKVKEIYMYYGFGINDLYSAGSSAATIIGFITNSFVAFEGAGARGVYVAPWGISSLSTGAGGYVFAYSAATEAIRNTVNQFVYTNRFGTNALFYNVIPTDQLVTDSIMNTNSGFSTDGLHFYSTNGPTMQMAIAELISGGHPVTSGASVPNSSYAAWPYDAYGSLWLGATNTPVLSRSYISPFTYTASGTTGAQTINKPSGVIRVAAAGTSVVLTDSVITTNTVVRCQIVSNDTTAKTAVSSFGVAGSSTITLNAAATAEVAIFFECVNNQ